MPDTLRFRVASGSCLECAGDVAETLRALAAVGDVNVLSGADVITVEHDGRLDAGSIQRAAARHSLTLVAGSDPIGHPEKPWWRNVLVLTIGAAALLLGATLLSA